MNAIIKPVAGQVLKSEHPKESDVVQIKCRGLLIVAHSAARKASALIFWNSEFDSQAIKKFVDSVSAPHSDWVWKAVGTASGVHLARQVLESLHIKLTSEVIRNSEFEGFFYPILGRLRLSVELQVQPDLKKKIRVLIVDDSQTIRQLLTKVFSSDADLEVIGALANPTEVEAFIEKNRPDVITLDIHMPEMDGVTLLKRYLPKYKIPTVMISSLSHEDGNHVFSALESGAVDYIQKPSFKDLPALSLLILEKIKTAALANLSRGTETSSTSSEKSATVSQLVFDSSQLIVIGSSTGGTEALREIMIRMPKEIPPILIVQHIPPVFSAAFAKRLNELCPFEVKEAEDGDKVAPNRVLIAPGGRQMGLLGCPGAHHVKITDDPPVNRHRPSVDYLFDTVAASKSAANTIAIILTGMGADGAKGMLRLREKGAYTIAQDEKSCVVFGMPREAIKLGAAAEITSLTKIPESIRTFLQKMKKAA